MRKLLLTTVIGIMTYPTLVGAVTCDAPPSCEELGYVYSASDCNGISAVKCPFNTSKLFCNKSVTTPTPTPTPSVDPCSVGQYYNVATKSCSSKINDERNGDEWLVMETSADGYCTLIGATQYTGARVTLNQGSEVEELQDVASAVERDCTDDQGMYAEHPGDGDYAPIDYLKYVFTKSNLSEIANNILSDDDIWGGGSNCYRLNGGQVTCKSNNTRFAHMCIRRNVPCNATAANSLVAPVVSYPTVTCEAAMTFDVSTGTCTGINQLKDPVNGNEWIVTESTAAGKCTVIGATKYTGAQPVTVYNGQEVDEYETALTAADEMCMNLFDGGVVASIEDIEFATIGYGNAAAFSIDSGYYVVGSGGKCFHVADGSIVDCPQGKDYAIYCKKQNVSCRSASTSSVFATTSGGTTGGGSDPNAKHPSYPLCDVGEFFNPSTKQCSIANYDGFDYIVVSNTSSGLRAVYIAPHSTGYSTYDGFVMSPFCELNGGELPTTEEMEMIFSKSYIDGTKIYNRLGSSEGLGTNSDMLFATSDKNRCVDSSVLGADEYGCSDSAMYSVACVKTYK